VTTFSPKVKMDVHILWEWRIASVQTASRAVGYCKKRKKKVLVCVCVCVCVCAVGVVRGGSFEASPDLVLPW